MTSRTSSLMHDIAKRTSVMKNPLQFKRQNDVKKNILNMNGICEYCEQLPASRKGGDHYKALVRNKMPTQYCHEPINLIPACAKCNSSKQGTDFFQWYTTSQYCRSLPRAVRRRVLIKMRKYNVAFNKEHTQRSIPVGKMRVIQKKVTTFLRWVDQAIDDVSESTNFKRGKQRV